MNTILSYWWIAAVIIVIIYLGIRARKKDKEANLLISQLVVQHQKEPLFFCKWADIFEGVDSAIQIQGLLNASINIKNKIIGPDGSEHQIIEIYPLTDDWKFDKNYNDSVNELSFGKKANVIISANSWKIPIGMEESQKAKFLNSGSYPQWFDFLNKIKNDKVVILKLKQ